jgi:preprotein translocase subunit SecE
LVEHWSPKPGVGSSSLSTRATNIMGSILNYIKESFNELRDHVTWTPIVELQKMTLVVLAFSIIFALIIWAADSILSEVFKLYFQFV